MKSLEECSICQDLTTHVKSCKKCKTVSCFNCLDENDLCVQCSYGYNPNVKYKKENTKPNSKSVKR